MNSGKVLTICVLLCFCLCPSISSAAAEPDLNELHTASKTVATYRTTDTNLLSSRFNVFNNLIRDGLISKTDACSRLSILLAGLRTEYYQRGGSDYPSTMWVFPVAGYGVSAIDKGRNHGFVPNGYDYFSGNRHGGHPAYDIFIRDRNHDNRDDRSGKAVGILSMSGGIVVALERVWQKGSRLRGGNYIWIYDPANDLLVYYAHNEELFVELGTIVKPGDLLSNVGRSGFNAAKRRSPTHLHFSVLHLSNGQPVPVPVYRELQLAGSVITR